MLRIIGRERQKLSPNSVKSVSYTHLLQHRYTVGKDYLPKPPEPLPPANDYPYEHPPTDLPQALGKLLLKPVSYTHLSKCSKKVDIVFIF